MKRIGFVLALGYFIAVSVVSVSAHVSESSNGVSAVMHILPDDNPVAGKPTYMQFTFGETNKSFQLGSCSCELVINDGVRDIKTVALKPLDPGSSVALAIVQLPSGGVYDVVATGYTDGRHTTRFRLDYLVRAAGAGQGKPHTAAGSQVIMISAASLAILGGVAFQRIRDNPKYTMKHPLHKK